MALLGQGNRNLRLLAERTSTEIHARGNEITVRRVTSHDT